MSSIKHKNNIDILYCYHIESFGTCIYGQVDSPESLKTPEITEIENFIKVTKDFTKLKDTLTNYIWEKSHFKKH